MSLCYDFQKWTMITLASVAISLTVGLLMQYAHGQNMTLGQNTLLLISQLRQQQKSLEELLNVKLLLPTCRPSESTTGLN
jgi:hypothetical protein